MRKTISCVVSEEDQGQAHAINKGLRRATGDIIGYLNSDDYYLDGALARVAERFSSEPDVALWHGRCRIVDQYGVKIDEHLASITRYPEILEPLGCLVEEAEIWCS